MHYLAAKASVARFAVQDRLRTRLEKREEGMETIEVAKREQAENARPELTGRVPDMDAYDTIILGYPN